MSQELSDKIRAAAQAKGIDPDVALAIAKAESGLRPKAEAETSSAAGLFQVVDKTWKQFGGNPKKKFDSDENIRVGTDIIASNTEYLRKALQRDPRPAEIYAAHYFGPTGAKNFLSADPTTPISNILSKKQIAANPNLQGKTAAQVLAQLEGKMGANVSRETKPVVSSPVKEREPLPPSLPPMAQADIKTPSVKPEAAARVASLGPGYQAALALSFLAETDDEEDRKTTITQEYLAKAQEDEEEQAAAVAARTRQANVFADLSNTTIRSPFAEPQQPVRMKDGGDVEGRSRSAKSLMEKFKDLTSEYQKDPIAFMRHYKMPTSPMGQGLNAGYAVYKHVTGKDPLLDLQKELSQRLNPETDTGDADSMPISVGLPPVKRAEGSPKEGERKLDRETMDMLRRQGTSPASLQRVTPPADISSSAAGLPGLMLLADPRIDNTNAYGYMLDGGDDTKNRAMAQAMFLNKSRSEDYPDTIAHETEHLLARQNLGSAANINSKFDELIGNKGISRLNFVRDAVKAAPYLKEKYDLQSSYLDPKMFEYQSKFGLGKNLLYEQLASLAALEQRHKIDLTKDPELRKTLFSRPDVRETYNALTGLRQTRLDPRDLPPHTRVPEPGMLDAIKGVFKRAEGGPVYRAKGSPEEGEMSNEGSITVQEAEVAKAIFPSLPVTEAVYLLRGGQRQSTPQGDVLSGNMGARIPLGKDAEAMLMLAGSRPEGRQDSSKALLAMLNQRVGEGSVGAQMVRPMDAPAGTYAGGVSGSYPVGEGRVMGNVNMMRMPGQDPRVTDYGVGYGGKVGPGELSAMIMRQKNGPYSGQIQYRLPIGRADGSPEEGEVAPRLTMQQIERLAAQEAAAREAASTPAFIAQKSGIGRKAGPISQALQSGQGQIEFLKGMTNIPQNLVGGAFDLSNMVAGIYGGNVEKPFMGSDYIKEGLRSKGLGFTPSTDPTLAAFYGAGDLGSNLVNPAGATRTAVKVAGKTGEAAKMLGNMAGQEFNAALMGERPGTIMDMLTAPAQPKYAVRNKGTPVAMSGLPFLSKVDEAEFLVKGVIGSGKQPLESTDKSLSDWFSKKLTRYLRSDFATPDDQLVKAAEEGKILHVAPKDFSDSASDQVLKNFLERRQSDLEYMRQAEGFGNTNMATQPYGQRIEDLTDISAYPERVGDLTPNRVPPSMRNLVDTQPETRVTDYAPGIVDNLKLIELRDKMLEVRQSNSLYGAYGQPAVKIPKDFLLPDKTLTDLNVAAASNRMARYTKWQDDTRQRMATTSLREDPRFTRAPLQDGKYLGVALPDVRQNPEVKQLVTDVGCDGGWCTRYSQNAKSYGSGFNRLHIMVTGEGKQARPVAQFAIADNGPSYDTKRFSIIEIKEKGNTADFANNPALPAIQEYVKFLDKSYGGLDYVDNLKGLRMTQLPEYPMRLLELFNPTVQQRRMLENKYGSEENGLRAVRDKAVDLNNGSRFMTGSEDAVANSLEQAMQLLVGPKETLARRIQMNLFGLPKEKATGGMIERQPTDNRRYL